MPTINCIGNDKVVNHHLGVTFYALESKFRQRNNFFSKTRHYIVKFL